MRRGRVPVNRCGPIDARLHRYLRFPIRLRYLKMYKRLNADTLAGPDPRAYKTSPPPSYPSPFIPLLRQRSTTKLSRPSQSRLARHLLVVVAPEPLRAPTPQNATQINHFDLSCRKSRNLLRRPRRRPARPQHHHSSSHCPPCHASSRHCLRRRA